MLDASSLVKKKCQTMRENIYFSTSDYNKFIKDKSDIRKRIS